MGTDQPAGTGGADATGERAITVVIPVKPWALAKSRIDVGVAARESLARAFSLDVIETVLASRLVGQIVLVTAERELVTVAAPIRAVVLADRPMLSPDALNVAVDTGRRWASRARPTSPVLVVPADLPAMTTELLDHAVDRLARHAAAFVPDASGHGTSLVWVSSPPLLHTSYGVRSASRHAGSGFRAIVDVDQRVRLDVDTRSDLLEARRLGTGRHTSAAVDELLTSGSGGHG